MRRTAAWRRSRTTRDASASDDETTNMTPSSSSFPYYGGDFAGLSVTYNSQTGRLIPVPEHWVPEALVEWGQVPNSLEVLVSEDLLEGEIMKRTTLTVLPDVGCGIDNLETQKTTERLSLGQREEEPTHTTIATLDSTSDDGNTITTETTFGMDDLIPKGRLRIGVTLQRDNGKNWHVSSSPVRFLIERQTNTTSSQGTRADGGGLDGRTVARLLGDDIRRFPLDQGSALSKEEDGTTTLGLPANVIISYETTETAVWLEISRRSAANAREGVRRTWAGDDDDDDDKPCAVDYWTTTPAESR